MKTLIIFYKKDSGQGLSDYALIISLIILVSLVAFQAFGLKVGDLYDFIMTEILNILGV